MESTVWAIIFFVFLALFIFQIIFSIRQAKIDEKQWKVLWADLATSHGFSFTQKIISDDGNTALAIDDKEGRLCLIAKKKTGIEMLFTLPHVAKVLLIYSGDLVSAELFEDGSTIQKTSRMSQAGGGLVGGLILGPAGVLIGGLTGKTVTSAGKVKRIDLRLVINDTNRPIYDINFLNSEVDRDSFRYKNAVKLSRHWLGVMEVLIRQADTEHRKTLQQNATHTEGHDKTSPVEPFSVANELEKLNSLRERGILNKDEFEQQKLRVLAGG